MELIQVFLPLYTNEGKKVKQKYFTQVKKNLIAKFKGVTFFQQTPVEGLWKNNGIVHHDEIIIAEILCNKINKKWWSNFKSLLEKNFEQKEILIRITTVKILR